MVGRRARRLLRNRLRRPEPPPTPSTTPSCRGAASRSTASRRSWTGWLDGRVAELTADTIRRAPKVLLHDHLDGGLRPATIIELAGEIGHELPAQGAEALGEWFANAANSGSH